MLVRECFLEYPRNLRELTARKRPDG